MELIRQAVERARGGRAEAAPHVTRTVRGAPIQPTHTPAGDAPDGTLSCREEIVIDKAVLEKNRIVAHDVANPLRKSFDILRTQVLQTMDDKDFHLLVVTSPGPACGKTVTSINLALSIARQPGRSVLLVDMDLQRPRVASYLGIQPDVGLLGVIEERVALSDAMIQARIGSVRFSTVLCEGSTADSSKYLTSQGMKKFLQDIRRNFRSQTVIIDMPPILSGDDVLTILPQIDGVLLVAAAGISTVSEIEDCSKHLQSTEVVRIVLNKDDERSQAYAGQYY